MTTWVFYSKIDLNNYAMRNLYGNVGGCSMIDNRKGQEREIGNMELWINNK